jgi:hypothetical protein
MFREFTSVKPGETRPERKQIVKFLSITFCSFLTSCGIFIAFGIVGLARFGDETLGDVLKSYGLKTGVAGLPGGVPHWLISICWVFIIVSISTTWIFAYNIMFDAFRDMLHDSIARIKKAFKKSNENDENSNLEKFDSAEEGSLDNDVDDPGLDDGYLYSKASFHQEKSFIDSKIFQFGMTAVFMGITFFTGSTIDSLATINFIKGATLTQLIIFILPAFMVLGSLKHFGAAVISQIPAKTQMFIRVLCWLAIFFGFFVMVVGLTSFGMGKNVK